MITRRAALLALLPMPALAQPRGGGGRRLEARLRAGAPPVALELAAVGAGRDRVQRLRATGAVTGEVILPTQTGATGTPVVLPLAGRDVVMINMAGTTGIGIAQQLGALIGADDAGRLRVIGLENLDARDNSNCESEGRLTGRFAAGKEGTLDFACAFQRIRGSCGQRWQGTPRREAWTDVLAWDGAGAIGSDPPPDDAPRIRHAMANARQKVAAMLTPVVADLRQVDWDGTGVTELVLLGLA